MHSIAIVEDEPNIRQNYIDVLQRQGYHVTGYSNREQALSAFRQKLPDLAILDIGLEDEIEGGFDLCRALRAISESIPIIFLTARDSDFDIISGLRLGADDYLTKDVSIPHLTTRIAALFRRIKAMNTPQTVEQVLNRGELRLDIERLSVHWKDHQIMLTLTEFWFIHTLAKKPGHVKNRDQLMDEANIVVDNATVTSHIKRIRKKFIESDPEFDAIDTVYGMGYRWHESSQ